MTSDFITFGAPQIQEAEISEVEACLRSGWLGTGPRVAQFEKDFALYKGLAHTQAAALNSCTAALHVGMVAANLEPGSEVVTTPLTFCATANAIIHAGLTPVLADVDPVTQCIDPAAIEAAITPRTSAILPVHFAGRPCDMDRIMQIADRHGLMVIEDCAHAIETEYRGRKAGTFGDIGCFSFYSTKNVATGEGGMIISSDDALIARAKVLALHGMSKDAWHRFGDVGYRHYQVVDIGFKYNMMDLQAAIGLHQLERVDANWTRRQHIWQQYMAAFADLPVGLPAPVEQDTRHGYHLFTPLIAPDAEGPTRDDALELMHRHGIGVGVHYLSLPEHPVYQQRFGWRPEQWPNAERIGRQTISLPISPKLVDSDIARVIAAFRSLFQHRAPAAATG
ncbi:UDP-4-amino-4,6-dideoxy-N-acetyl-beta-L-altrosamine transaminase [Lysobacteraceae bacterium NML93-0792]|nr:UDP-4-amino-4,6-dideoxy-N-acetyl-beta-L-altrosamine transaminase [Xanthomonadaceae bacterium NML93-0792]PBS14792.1 UDP-4-amino-4,6-dideoxy-N-acetyl-beta-L-altrosamine transaminase [Xanthomonadaceae bacterium NML93-0793]PBS18784.1 UDP-4-amino-4,6-dideoxy-N-acetyl-beta-L-altrosamine transaminase [Xanthomonadaceae bacterium NML93-0831]